MKPVDIADSWAIGVDLGGTKINVGLMAPGGSIVSRYKESTEASRGPVAIIEGIIASIRKLQDSPNGKKIASIGVAMAGQIDPDDGSVFFAPNLSWHHVPLQKQLHDALGLPVMVLNDVRAATFGEWMFGAGRGVQDFLCLFIGTGIGGGAVLGGRLLTGSNNSAAEFGHMTIALKGRECHCGNLGCLEALAGGRAIAEIAQEAVLKDPLSGALLLESVSGEVSMITAIEVVQGAKNGDPFAKKLMDDVAFALIGGIVGLVNAFNPQRVILGGGIMGGMPQLLERIDEGVRQFALKSATENLSFLHAELKGNAGVVGAAAFSLCAAKGL